MPADLAAFRAPPRPGPEGIEGRFMAVERLDPARHADPLFAANAGADTLFDFMGVGPWTEFAAYRAWQEAMAAQTDPFFYAICPRNEAGAAGKARGVAAFLRIEPAHGVIEIGHIQFSPALQRTAAASEAILTLIRWAFRAGYRRVEWKCDARNAASRRAAARFGFRFEGIFRQHMIVKGRNRDTAWFAITDPDWPALDEAYRKWLAPDNFDATGENRVSLSVLTGAVGVGAD